MTLFLIIETAILIVLAWGELNSIRMGQCSRSFLSIRLNQDTPHS